MNDIENMELDTLEEWEKRETEINSAIEEYFVALQTETTPREDLVKFLEEETDLVFDGATEFFKNCGLLDQDGNPTDYGRRLLPPTVGTHDDRNDQEHEPAQLAADAWTENGYYAVTIIADQGDASKTTEMTVKGYNDYTKARDVLHEQGYYITREDFQTEAQYFPGFLTYEDAVNEFKTADERHLELKSFPQFSKMAKIRIHDSAVIAADTGAGKSSLAINFLNDLNDDYPVLYFNLEMDGLTILRRLVAIRTGIELDRIEGYQTDEHTEAAVNSALRAITSRKPLQILKDVYTLEEMETVIKMTTEDREDPTIVIIDHSLLVQTKDKKTNGDRYKRFTLISEELRRISRQYNIVLFILLQQSREGKKDDTEPPKNSSLKESGSWENDATQIIFLWYDPSIKRKKLLITKNRNGNEGSFLLNYTKETQTYQEAKEQTQGGGASFDSPNLTNDATGKTKRDKMRDKLRTAYVDVVAKTGEGNVTLKDLAEVLDVKTATVKGYLKEYGGFTLDGETVDPAGIDNIVENSGFIRLTPGEAAEAAATFDDPGDVIG